MKELIISSPVIMSLIVATGIIPVFILFHYASTNQKIASSLEKCFLGIFILSISGTTGVTIMPFDKLQPLILTNDITTLPTVVGQLGIYAFAIFIITFRLSSTLKNFIDVVIQTIAQSPFLFLLILEMGLSIFWSTDPMPTFKLVIVIFEASIFAIYFGKQYSWKEIYPLWRWVNILVVILGVCKALTESQSPWVGILGHKNAFSFFVAQTAILWLMHAVYSRKQRFLSFGFVILSLIALLKGNSGASKVLTVVMLSLWAYFGFVKKMKVQWAVVSVILFMIASICLTILITENLEFIVVDTLNKDLTLTGRTEFWPIIVDKINQRPVLGYGVAGFWQPWRGGDNPGSDVIVASSGFQPMHSHNGFLDLGLNLGWLGVGLFALSFFHNVIKGVVYLGRTRLPEAGLPLLLLTYALMINLTESSLLGVTSVWFWYVVLTVRLSLDTTGSMFRNQSL